MKKLRIAQLAPLTERVPPPKYGGIELVVSNLTEELIRRGHKVTLFASGNSKTKAKLVSRSPYPLRRETSSSRLAHTLLQIEKILNKQEEFDLIHNHVGWLPLFFSKFASTPWITTLHGRLSTALSQKVFGHFRNSNYISLSFNQRKYLPFLNYVANVYNGVDIKKFEFDNNPMDYLVFLGRISSEKGVIQAIRIAKKVREKLIIAAKIDKGDEEYWKKKVKPQIDGKQVVYIGEIGHTRKVRLLKNAQALINPISWPEPFGLVMIEAMACGTPVIAPKRASVSEIVVNKKTGFIINPKNLIRNSARAVRKINQIDRQECRKHVERNFTVEKMVDGYEKAYYKILKL